MERAIGDMSKRLDAQPKWSRAWDVGIKALVPIVIAITGWGLGHEIRVSNLELTQFNKTDAHTMHNQIVESMPPQWLRDDIAELKQLIRSMDDRLRKEENGK